MDENEIVDHKTACIGLAIVFVAALSYRKIALNERKKRRQRESIQQWKIMNLEAIHSSYGRLREIAQDPNANAKDLITAWREEEEFLKLIKDQPMY